MVRSGLKAKVLLACFATAAVSPAVSLAQQPAAKPVTVVPGRGVSATDTIEARATVTKIDAATRTVTLKGEQGEFEVQAGPEVKNFDRIKVGDVVVAAYTQSIAARIAKPGEAAEVGIKGGASATTPDKGGAKVGREVTATLNVEAVDTKANTVTLSAGPDRKQTVSVVNPQVQERLKTLKPGDKVVVTYTESLALRLEPVAKM